MRTFRTDRRSWGILVALAACASAPDARPEDVAELALTQAAEAFSTWLDVEIHEALALAGESQRQERLGELAQANRTWNALEDAFDAAQTAYRSGRGDPGEVRTAFDRALAFLHAAGVQ